MTRRVSSVAAAAALTLLALAAPTVAQDDPAPPVAEFSGDWRVGFDAGRGLSEWDLHLTVDAGEIAGEATHPELSGYRFTVEGRQTGDEVNFILYIDIPAHEDELYFTGTLSGDEAQGQVVVRDELYLWSAGRTG